MITRRSFGALASSFPLGLAILPAQASTPTDTLVIAKQIDDLLTLDPGECYENSGVEVDTNLYDRILRYEPEDLTKLVGGVAESWTVSQDGKNYTFKIRPGLKFQSGAPVTAEDAAWSLQRVAILNNTRRPNDRLFGATPVMPAQAGIHDFLCCDEDKSWIPACAGMTGGSGPYVNV
jgi:peptide/nickel transport system substrate-binding protein